jgi:hypothetical protein
MRDTVGYRQDETPPAPEPAQPRAPKGEPINLIYHQPRCSICNHPDREAIEQGILHWERPSQLARQYDLGHRRAVYRHARAFGLFKERAARTRRSLEFIMEQAESVTATADSIIRAVRAHSCLGEDGRWTEPTRRVIITHKYVNRPLGGGPDLSDLVDSNGRPKLDPRTLAKQANIPPGYFSRAEQRERETSPKLMDTRAEQKSA